MLKHSKAVTNFRQQFFILNRKNHFIHLSLLIQTNGMGIHFLTKTFHLVEITLIKTIAPLQVCN